MKMLKGGLRKANNTNVTQFEFSFVFIKPCKIFFCFMNSLTRLEEKKQLYVNVEQQNQEISQICAHFLTIYKEKSFSN